MNPEQIFDRYHSIQNYIGWTDQIPQRIVAIAPLLRPLIPDLVDDFYHEIQRHPAASKVITGGDEQIMRLRVTLRHWLEQLLSGQYDRDYVLRRWRVGLRHVEIGLDQVFTNAALSRLRSGLARGLAQRWMGEPAELWEHLAALHQVLDLDLAIIEDAYQSEYAARLQRTERLATLGQIAGGIAHELRNPLNVIKTSIYFLLHAKNITPEKRLEHLQRIERQVTLSDEVITALTNFARMPLPELTPFDVVACLREILEHSPSLKAYDVIM
ncbi:MAG: protoglobin domain-containing protein, partial [Gemmataceae bacterium]